MENFVKNYQFLVFNEFLVFQNLTLLYGFHTSILLDFSTNIEPLVWKTTSKTIRFT